MADLQISQDDIAVLADKLSSIRSELTPAQNKILDVVLAAGSSAMDSMIGNSAATLMPQIRDQTISVQAILKK